MSQGCYFCGTEQDAVLERHHIVPRRHGGRNTDENLVEVCASHHRALEQLYDKRFYDQLRDRILEEQAWKVMRQARTRIQESVETFIQNYTERGRRELFAVKDELYYTYDKYCKLNGNPAFSPRIFNNRVKRGFDVVDTTRTLNGNRVEVWEQLQLIKAPEVEFYKPPSDEEEDTDGILG